MSELDAGWAARPVAELALCGEHLLEVAQACGFEGPRPAGTVERVPS